MRGRFIFFFFLFIPILLLFFLTRGVVLYDEGYILHYSERLFQGQLPYRDFHFVYTPASLFLTALSFKLFGVNILASRILMMLIAVLSSWLVFSIVKRVIQNSYLSYSAALLFIVWGSIHVNFSWPVIYALLASLLSIFFLLTPPKQHVSRNILLSGIFVFVTFLCKQNFGPMIFLCLLPYFYFLKKQRVKSFLIFSGGLFTAGFLFLMFLSLTHSLQGFINDMYEFTIRRILYDRDLTTPFLYKDTFIKTSGRAFIYLLLPLSSIYAMRLLYVSKKREFLFVPLFVLGFYFVGIRPTTDYIHLVPLLSLLGLSLSTIITFSKNGATILLTQACIILCIIAGLYTALFKGYYRWDSPLILHSHSVNLPKAKVKMNRESSIELTSIVTRIQSESQKNDAIYVHYYAPLLYFLSDRKALSGYDFLENDVDFMKYQKVTIAAIEKEQLKIVVTNTSTDDNTPFMHYLKSHYKILDSVGNFVIWKRGYFLAKLNTNY